MNAPTIVIALVIAGLLALAVRRLVRRGACSACEQHDACAVSGAQCAGRAPGQAGRTTVVLGMPGGLTHASTGSCCEPAQAAHTAAADAPVATAGAGR